MIPPIASSGCGTWTIVREALPEPCEQGCPVVLKVDRLTLAKRRWRGTAEDGAEFGFVLDAPLEDGAAFWMRDGVVYRVEQMPEPVLEVALIPRAAPVARLGWVIGNLHFEIEVTEECVRVPDDPALRQLFTREAIPFREEVRVFRPFARGHSHGGE